MSKSKPYVFSNYAWKKNINYFQHPELYRVGKGEQGVLICEPYKSQILPFWKFKTPELANKSAKKIYRLFQNYLARNDFVGADMARKFLQMGFTRARRYANYRSGRKYDDTGKQLPKGTGTSQKALSAEIFYNYWRKAEQVPKYNKLKRIWKEKYG